MTKNKVMDMTQGRPLPLLLRFALPLVLGSIFQQLYSLADTAIVGRCISVDALSAVGVTHAVGLLVLGITMGSAMGFCIPISQSVGAGEWEDISRYFWNGLYLSIGIGLVVSVGMGLLARPVLVLSKTPDELLDMAQTYLTIVLMGQITTVLYNYFAGVLRAFGDSKRPFYFLLAACFINVVLDLVLILVIPMGVAGAALATVISQGISAALCAWWLFTKQNAIQIQLRGKCGESLAKPSCAHIARSCIVGVPLGLEYSVTAIGMVILQGSINTLGTVAAAAQICGERIRAIATTPMESVGMAMATYVGQNYGATRMDRIKSGIRSGLAIQAVYAAAAWAALLVLKKPLVNLLLGETASPEAVGAIQYLTIITTLFIFHGSMMIFRNTVQGMGYGISAMASAAMETAGRSMGGLLAVHLGNFTLVCVSNPMAWILAMICCMLLSFYYIEKESRRSAA